jgi:hypothetical protein
MLVRTILFLFGLATAIIHFALFQKMIKSAGEEAGRYVDEFLGRRKINWIVPVLVVVALIVKNTDLAIALVIVALIWGAYAAFEQDTHLEKLNFSDGFRRRLLRISGLVPVAIVFFLAGQIWAATLRS